MKIIGYTYGADCHCISCAQDRFLPGTNSGTPDDNGIPFEQTDREGNRIHPMFSISSDEQIAPEYCGDCRERIE